MTPAGAELQLRAFIDKFQPAHRTLIRSVRKELRKRMPTAYELAYDNYNFFVIGYSPTERPSDSVLSIAAGANGVGLCFIHGAKLRDPNKLLQGSGKQTRFVRIESPATLGRPEVQALIHEALEQARVPMREKGRRELIIRSVSTTQRPRVAGST